MRSPRRDHTPRVAESLQTRLKKTFFGLVFIVAVTIAFSAVPILMKDLDVSAVPLEKVLSYEANILLMEAGIGLGDSYSKQSDDQPTLRHVIVLAHNGAKTPDDWLSHEGPYAWGSDLMPGALTMSGLYQSFLLGRDFRQRYGAALGLDDPNDEIPPRNASVSAPRARSPMERININCHPMASAIDTGLGVALGMFSSDEAASAAASAAIVMAAGRGMPDLLLDCHCRMDGLLIGTVDCAAACLQLGDDAIPNIPSVNVRSDQIHSVSQSRVCAGWRDWLWQLYSDEIWQEVADSDFANAKDVIRELLHGDKLMFRTAPEGECAGCLAGNETDWNWILLEERVWESVIAHDADGLRYVEGKTNKELLQVLQPAAEFSWKAHFAGDQGRHHSGVLLHEIFGLLESAEATAQYCRRAADTRDRCPDTHALMSLYTGPLDSVLAPLSLLAPLDDLPLPAFGSHLAIELWEDNLGDHYYDNSLSKMGRRGPIHANSKKGQTKGGPRSPEHAEAPGPPGQRFTVKLTYDGKPLQSSTACPGGTCMLSKFLDAIQGKITTECTPDSYDRGIPTWDIDASCCNNS